MRASAGGEVLAAPARLWQRLGAFVLDGMLLSALVLALLFIASLVVGRSTASSDRLTAMLKLAGPGLALGAVFGLAYATLAAVLFQGRTAGRFVFRIRLVDSSGDAPRLPRALVRAALAMLSFGLLLSGFWLALFDRKGQTLHDKLSGTFVVRSLS